MELTVAIISGMAGVTAIAGAIAGFVRWVYPRFRKRRSISLPVPHADSLSVSGSSRADDAGKVPTIIDATALKERGKAYRSSSQFVKAEQCFNQALEIMTKQGHIPGRANALMNRGILFRMKGEYRLAEQDHREADQLLRGGNPRAAADNLKGLGEVFRDDGDFEQAIEIHKQALALYEQIKDRAGEARMLHQLGVDHGSKDPETANNYFDRAEAVRSKV